MSPYRADTPARIRRIAWKCARFVLCVVGLTIAWVLYLFILGPLFGYGEPD